MANPITAQAKAFGKLPLVFSLCERGKSLANNIGPNSFYSWVTDFYGPGRPDMLEVGNSVLTYEEDKVHFAGQPDWTANTSVLPAVLERRESKWDDRRAGTDPHLLLCTSSLSSPMWS
ncbi:hypothetical protein B0H10DRAFT_2235294 [Mycena sp. CBHHK59/15]|nr:hypothetical protein B0H10DRAFT_2235294 [Mycena sp. CBHHK59/15]